MLHILIYVYRYTDIVKGSSRTGSRNIIKTVLAAISDKPMSIREISQKYGFGWESVRNYLETLRDAGVVNEVDKGNKRLFMRSTPLLSKRKDTYFGLPLDSKFEKKIDSAYSKIKEFWEVTNGTPLKKVHAQKILQNTNKKFGWDLPIGWYQFGSLCVKVYEPGVDYAYSGLKEGELKHIKTLVQKYSNVPAYRVMWEQYENSKNILYSTKEDLKRLFFRNNPSRSDFEIYLYRIYSNLPIIDESESRKYVDEFFSLSTNAFRLMNNTELEKILPMISALFEKVWRLIALYNYKASLSKHYPKEVLQLHFQHDIVFQQVELDEYLSYVYDFVPEEPEESESFKGFQKRLFKGS